MAKKTQFSKLQRMNITDRQRAVSADSSLLYQLTPTEIALLFPDYFKRGKPDVGGFREAISRNTAEQQTLWQKGVQDRLAQQGGWLERMRSQYSNGSFTDSSAGRGGKQFQALAPKIMRDLQRDFPGLSKEDAAAIVGNLGEESGGFGQMSEAGGKGPGRGWAQWTSPDRKAKFLANVQKYGGDLANYQANYETLRDELRGNYAGALRDMMAAKGLDNKTEIFMRKFENPGVPAYDVRMRYAQRAMNVYETDTTTPGGQQAGATTPSQGGGQTTGGGTSFQVKSGYVVPTDGKLYDPRNAQQCATLGKAFNPNIGRSSGWTVVDGDIKAGQVVATKQYNNSGADRTGSGYHTGVALTAPNEKGDFLLLEQYNNSGGAKTRWVNKNSYPTGKEGGTTSWGLISSNGKVHDEVSQEALQYGKSVGGASEGKSIGTNAGAPGAGGDVAPGVAGTVEAAPDDGQTASLMQPNGMMPNLMGSPMNMMMGMMGMGGMQSATPLGLVTTAMGFIMPLIGTFMGERMSGEGMGAPVRGYRRHGRSHHHHGAASANRYNHTSSKTATAAPKQSGPFTVGDPAKAQKLLSFISKGEGGYNSMNQGTVGKRIVGSTNDSSKKIGKNLTDMTIAEVMKMQEGTLKSGRKLFAVGKYQIIPQTMKAIVAKAGIDPNSKFDQATQDKLGMALIQSRPRLNDYLTGKSNDQRGAMIDFAEEWASLPHPDTGKSAHGHGNKASHSIESVRQALAATRADMTSSGTQLAQATPQATTGVVGAGITTPSSASVITPQQMAQAPGFGERLASFVGGSKGAQAAPVSGTTPLSTDNPVTPSTTAAAGSSMSIAATPAPTSKFPAASRNAIGAYSTPARNDIMYQFAKNKVTAPPQITGTPGALPAPGPAPDMASAQMGAMRTEMAAIAQQQSTPVMAQQPSIQSAPAQGFNADHAMKQIGMPMNTPSFQRAMFNVNGETTPGEVGQNHFSYGNAR